MRMTLFRLLSGCFFVSAILFVASVPCVKRGHAEAKRSAAAPRPLDTLKLSQAAVVRKPGSDATSVSYIGNLELWGSRRLEATMASVCTPNKPSSVASGLPGNGPLSFEMSNSKGSIASEWKMSPAFVSKAIGMRGLSFEVTNEARKPTPAELDLTLSVFTDTMVVESQHRGVVIPADSSKEVAFDLDAEFPKLFDPSFKNFKKVKAVRLSVASSKVCVVKASIKNLKLRTLKELSPKVLLMRPFATSAATKQSAKKGGRYGNLARVYREVAVREIPESSDGPRLRCDDPNIQELVMECKSESALIDASACSNTDCDCEKWGAGVVPGISEPIIKIIRKKVSSKPPGSFCTIKEEPCSDVPGVCDESGDCVPPAIVDFLAGPGKTLGRSWSGCWDENKDVPDIRCDMTVEEISALAKSMLLPAGTRCDLSDQLKECPGTCDSDGHCLCPQEESIGPNNCGEASDCTPCGDGQYCFGGRCLGRGPFVQAACTRFGATSCQQCIIDVSQPGCGYGLVPDPTMNGKQCTYRETKKGTCNNGVCVESGSTKYKAPPPSSTPIA